MNSEAHEYRVLIMNMRRIGREVDYVLNYINRYERYIQNGLIVNGEKSFDKDLNGLKDVLTNKRNNIFNNIIPSLEDEMIEAMSR